MGQEALGPPRLNEICSGVYSNRENVERQALQARVEADVDHVVDLSLLAGEPVGGSLPGKATLR